MVNQLAGACPPASSNSTQRRPASSIGNSRAGRVACLDTRSPRSNPTAGDTSVICLWQALQIATPLDGTSLYLSRGCLWCHSAAAPVQMPAIAASQRYPDRRMTASYTAAGMAPPRRGLARIGVRFNGLPRFITRPLTTLPLLKLPAAAQLHCPIPEFGGAFLAQARQ